MHQRAFHNLFETSPVSVFVRDLFQKPRRDSRGDRIHLNCEVKGVHCDLTGLKRPSDAWRRTLVRYWIFLLFHCKHDVYCWGLLMLELARSDQSSTQRISGLFIKMLCIYLRSLPKRLALDTTSDHSTCKATRIRPKL